MLEYFSIRTVVLCFLYRTLPVNCCSEVDIFMLYICCTKDGIVMDVLTKDDEIVTDVLTYSADFLYTVCN